MINRIAIRLNCNFLLNTSLNNSISFGFILKFEIFYNYTVWIWIEKLLIYRNRFNGTCFTANSLWWYNFSFSWITGCLFTNYDTPMFNLRCRWRMFLSCLKYSSIVKIFIVKITNQPPSEHWKKPLEICISIKFWLIVNNPKK